MKLAIIGCGYVGSEVARLWHQQGERVTVTTTSPSKQQQLQDIASEVVVLMGNDFDGLQQLVADKDVVLFSVGAKQRTADTYHQAYLETTNNVVRAIRATGSVRQLIYTSSYGILGKQEVELVILRANLPRFSPTPNKYYSLSPNRNLKLVFYVCRAFMALEENLLKYLEPCQGKLAQERETSILIRFT